MISKIIRKALLLAGLVAIGVSSSHAWDHTLSTPGSWSTYLTVPACVCTQICEGALYNNLSTNYGPLANLQLYGIVYQKVSGPVAAGTYYIYQAETVTYGGFSTTVFAW